VSPDYFDRLEAELRWAVPRATGVTPAPGVRWWRGRLGRPILALNAAVIVALAVALVVVLGKGHPAHRTSPAQRTATPHPAVPHVVRGVTPGNVMIAPPGAVATLSQLLQNFAILRRPQTAADRSWRPNCDCAGAARQLNQYTRLVKTLSGGYRVFLDLEQFIQGGQENQLAGSYSMEYTVVSPNGNTSSAPYGTGNYGVLASETSDHIFVSIVPDGVATVSWTFTCQGKPNQCVGVAPRTMTVPVTGNMAVQRVTGGVCPNLSDLPRKALRDRKRVLALMTGCLTSDQTTWRAADGRIVAAFPVGYGNLAAPPFVKGVRTNGALHVLKPNGVGAARLGESFAAATRTINQLLGPAAVTHVAVPQRQGGCGVATESVWTSPTAADPLELYERSGRFVGYQYGAPLQEIGLQQGPGPVLTTENALTIGATVTAARRRYGQTFRAHAIPGSPNSNGGGAWHIAEAGGGFGGALLPSYYPVRAVRPADQIATITAGQADCPATGG
jgi:hypothetical protein